MTNKIQEWMERNPIVQARARANMSRALLAAAVGVSQSTVQLWESGGRPSPEYLPALQKVFGTPIVHQLETYFREQPSA